MRSFKILLLAISLAISFTFCVNSESQNNSKRDYTSVELLGKWIPVSSNKSLNKKGAKIESIHLLKDSKAKIQLINSTGERILKGTWQNGIEKKLKNSKLVFKSDIEITYYPNKQNKNILLLKLSRENNNLIMTGNQLEFKKE